jgi:eukaryotic-like serine/threonine-protein kinase
VHQLEAGDPAQVGPYLLVGRLGEGGMGRVYLGRSVGGRLVAVKVIRPELADSVEFRTRFGQEVAAAQRVSGFYTAAVVDADADPSTGPPWLATAYVPGPSLATAIDACGPLPGESLRLLAAGLAEALRAIHRSGMVHRDLKPGNVLLAIDGPRVIDFGIARATDLTGLARLTRSGTIGTAGFMAPEQAEGREVTSACDIFAFGIVLAYAATARLPFGDGLPPAVVYRIVHAEPDLDGIAEPFRGLVAGCLAKDMACRPTAEDILATIGFGPDDTVQATATGWLPPAFTTLVTEYEADAPGTPATLSRSSARADSRNPAGPRPLPSASAWRGYLREPWGIAVSVVLGMVGTAVAATVVTDPAWVAATGALVAAGCYGATAGVGILTDPSARRAAGADATPRHPVP